jgi:hypothetical protein
MLFEWPRDRKKEQAYAEMVSLKEFKIMHLTYWYFKYNFLFFLTIPCREFMRFKKNYPWSAGSENTPQFLKHKKGRILSDAAA